MLIEEKALKHWIDNFYGYGSWHARFWFVGYEEGGAELPEEVAERINYFQKEHSAIADGTLCNIRELYRHVAIRWDSPKAGLFSNRYEYRFDNQAIQNSVWRNLVAFEHGYKNEEVPDTLAYQKHTFASPDMRREALVNLYPLPSPHHHGWYYSWLDLPQLAFLKRRTLYEEHVYPDRIQRILTNVKAYKPELILMYGMNNINTLKKSILDVFGNAKFKMVKAIKLQVPQYHHTMLGETTLLITTQIPALRHNRVETGFDWEEFGKKVKSEK